MTTKLQLLGLILAAGLIVALGTLPASAAPLGQGKFSVIGTGPAGPEHATLKALETMKKADLVLCHPELAKKFQTYLKGKKVEDPWQELWFHQGKVWMKELPRLNPEERQAVLKEKVRQRDEYVKKIRAFLSQGKKVALLDGGDPTVYSRACWLLEGLDDGQVEVIPGVGAASASMAALKRASTGSGARFVAQTAPFSFFGTKAMTTLPGTSPAIPAP